MLRLCFATATLLLAACTHQLPQSPPGGIAPAAEAPDIRPETFWRYAVSDGFTRLPRGTVELRVDKIEAGTLTVQALTDAGETTELYTRDLSWIRRPATNLQVFEYTPPYRAFDFPLTAGKKWHYRGAALDPADGRSYPVRIDAEVLGWEKVRVPAGEFDALKVRRYVILDYWQQGVRGQSVITELDWYAPALHQAVRREATSKYLRLAQAASPFVRVRRDRDGDERLPRYEQDDWLVYELVAHGTR